MKIAIISDVHDNLVNLNKCLAWCDKEKINNLICCGDITNSETLEILSSKFKNKIYLVRGNLEIYDEEEVCQYANIKYLGRFGRFELDNKIIGVCHEPSFINKVLEAGKRDIIFYGHTHRPWIEEKNGIKHINPGTLGGVFQKATFAVWDTDKKEPELKILESL
jgi:hypothetical protein